MQRYGINRILRFVSCCGFVNRYAVGHTALAMKADHTTQQQLYTKPQNSQLEHNASRDN